MSREGEKFSSAETDPDIFFLILFLLLILLSGKSTMAKDRVVLASIFVASLGSPLPASRTSLVIRSAIYLLLLLLRRLESGQDGIGASHIMHIFLDVAGSSAARL